MLAALKLQVVHFQGQQENMNLISFVFINVISRLFHNLFLLICGMVSGWCEEYISLLVLLYFRKSQSEGERAQKERATATSQYVILHCDNFISQGSNSVPI